MSYYVSHRERQIIRSEIRNQLLNEGLFDSIASMIPTGLVGTAEGVLPDTVFTGIKKMMIKSFMQKMGITSTHPMAEFMQNLIANITVTDLVKIIKREIECAEIGEIILKAATQTLTVLGIKKIAVPLVHYFAEHSFDSSAPNFIKKEDKFKSITQSNVNTMIDSMVGVLGETLISKIIYSLVKEKMVPIIQNQVCDELLGKGSKPKITSGEGFEGGESSGSDDSSGKTSLSTKANSEIAPGPVLDASSGDIEGDTMSESRMIRRYNRNMTRTFSRNELYLIREYCQLTRRDYINAYK